MSYFWPEGVAVVVDVDGSGRPIRLVVNGSTHSIASVWRGWIIDDYWWVARIWRAYYLITTHSGLLLVLFHNKLTNRWYVERLYD